MKRVIVLDPPSGEPVWIEGEPSWHGWAVIVIYCFILPVALAAIAVVALR